MIKIDVAEREGQSVITVEGGITDIFVDELKRCWRDVRARVAPADASRRITVNLEGVTRVDARGRQLLGEMHRDGVGFTGARLAIQDIVRDAQTASAR